VLPSIAPAARDEPVKRQTGNAGRLGIVPPELHPWNKEFVWSQPSGPYRALTDTQAKQFDEDGYVLVTGVIDDTTVAEVTSALDVEEQRVTDWLSTQPGKSFSIATADEITFTTHVVTRVPAARAFATHPVFKALCMDLIGPTSRLYWDQAVYKKPEREREFPWHQDNGYTFVEPQQYLTCWVPLTEATVDNGCPWVVPGLHRLGTLAHRTTRLGYQCLDDPSGAVPVEAEPGDVVVFSSLTPHRTGPNCTDRVRKAYILQYAPDGAEVLAGNANDGPPTGRVPQTDPDRQFEVM
jgi:ectoine hydroxylase-related dioxygenase (phytanoyl-CoA dioxygenase family)